MSQLPNAPLLEVIFMLTWHLSEEELNNFSFISGDFYNQVKDPFKSRDSLIPDNMPIPFVINKPTIRFTKPNQEYPQILLGPGVMSLNTIEKMYSWDGYLHDIEYSAKAFLSTINDFNKIDHIHLVLKYIDFLPFKFEENNIIQYLNSKLHTSISQTFENTDTIDDVNLNIRYAKGDSGHLSIQVSKGKVNEESGIIIQTSMISPIIQPSVEDIKNWSIAAHEICSTTFKEMTKGELYDSFM